MGRFYYNVAFLRVAPALVKLETRLCVMAILLLGIWPAERRVSELLLLVVVVVVAREVKGKVVVKNS